MGWSLKRAVIRDRVLRRAVTRGVTAYRRGMIDPRLSKPQEGEPGRSESNSWAVSMVVLAVIIVVLWTLLR